MSSMPERPLSPELAARLLRELRESEGLRHRRVQGAEPDAAFVLVRQWQSERLSRTYADLLVSPRYGPACRFFLADMYAPRDFTQRDHDIQRVYEYLTRFLPQGMLRTLAAAIEANVLTQQLDRSLAGVLAGRLDVTDTISVAQYVEGYRLCDNYAARVRQIELMVEIGTDIDGIVKIPLAGMTLRAARGPAHHAGWFQLQDFLERGYHAFKNMHGAAYFLETIAGREQAILDRIYERHPDPFG